MFPRAFGAGDTPISGFSTIEILIAFAVGIVFLSAAMMVAFSGQQSYTGTGAGIYNGTSTDVGQAAALDLALDNYGLATSSNRIGKIIANLTKSWNTPSGHGDGGEKINDNLIYGNTSSIQDISPCMKEITSTTTWSSLNNRNHHITFGTAIGSIDQAKLYGRGGCDPTPPSDWDNPVSFASMDVPAVSAKTIDAIHFQNKTIAVLGSIAGADPKSDLYIFDVSDPDTPTPLGNLNVLGKGINDLVAINGYVYAVRDDNTNQFVIIDIHDLENPTLIASKTFTNVSGAHPQGQTIAYYDNHVYIGTWNNNVPAGTFELVIIDVSDPLTPIQVGGYNLGHSINDIAVHDGYAYLATTNNTGELTVMNVQDHSTPTIAGTYDVPGSNRDAESLYLLNNRLYLGLMRSATADDITVLDIHNPNSIARIGGINLHMNGTVGVVSILVQGRFAFVGTSDTNDEFRVLDIQGANPIPYGCPPYNYSAHISEIAYADNLIFAANENNNSLRIIHDDTTTQTCH